MKNVLNKKIAIGLLIILTIALIYISDITNLPSDVILFEGETLELNTIFGVNLKTASTTNPNIEKIENNETITVSTSAESDDYTGEITLDVEILGLKVKEVNVSVIEETTVVPLGNLIGVKLYTYGVLVVGMSEISGEKPYENSGIVEGDIITKVNDEEITETAELVSKINESAGNEMKITYIRDRGNI